MSLKFLAGAVAMMVPCAASAVYLNPDGLGQALIYPYYTAQAASGNPFNTYISLANHTRDAKAVRVRVREGRNAAEVASFNLFLSPNDMWTGAVIPNGIGAAMVTRDTSCVQGPFAVDFSFPPSAPKLDFRNALYSGANADGGGEGLDRTREGYVEVFEMGTLSGAAQAGVTHDASGLPVNCAAVADAVQFPVGPPTGGLSGTLTLINVTSGLDFTVNAEALAELATQPYYRPVSDRYPDFSAAEVTPLSIVATNGFVFRSQWARGVDAVSAVLMRSTALAEVILDAGTHSGTDVVTTFPTWRHYVSGSGASAPFAQAFTWPSACAATAGISGHVGLTYPAIEMFSRQGVRTALNFDDLSPRPPDSASCSAASTIYDFMLGPVGQAVNPLRSPVLGSSNRKFANGPSMSSFVENGWIRIDFSSAPPMVSLATSTRIDSATGASITGSHRFRGLPMVGLFARTFANGTLSCSGGSCQGNYGGAFPLHFFRTIEQVN